MNGVAPFRNNSVWYYPAVYSPHRRPNRTRRKPSGEFNWENLVLAWIKFNPDFEYSDRRIDSYMQVCSHRKPGTKSGAMNSCCKKSPCRRPCNF